MTQPQPSSVDAIKATWQTVWGEPLTKPAITPTPREAVKPRSRPEKHTTKKEATLQQDLKFTNSLLWALDDADVNLKHLKAGNLGIWMAMPEALRRPRESRSLKQLIIYEKYSEVICDVVGNLPEPLGLAASLILAGDTPPEQIAKLGGKIPAYRLTLSKASAASMLPRIADKAPDLAASVTDLGCDISDIAEFRNGEWWKVFPQLERLRLTSPEKTKEFSQCVEHLPELAADDRLTHLTVSVPHLHLGELDELVKTAASRKQLLQYLQLSTLRTPTSKKDGSKILSYDLSGLSQITHNFYAVVGASSQIGRCEVILPSKIQHDLRGGIVSEDYFTKFYSNLESTFWKDLKENYDSYLMTVNTYDGGKRFNLLGGTGGGHFNVRLFREMFASH